MEWPIEDDSHADSEYSEDQFIDEDMQFAEDDFKHASSKISEEKKQAYSHTEEALPKDPVWRMAVSYVSVNGTVHSPDHRGFERHIGKTLAHMGTGAFQPGDVPNVLEYCKQTVGKTKVKLNICSEQFKQRSPATGSVEN